LTAKCAWASIKDDLMVRLDPTVYAAALKKKGCHEMTFTGRALKGFVLVGQEGNGQRKRLQLLGQAGSGFQSQSQGLETKVIGISGSAARDD
jgi:hypothetical protein